MKVTFLGAARNVTGSCCLIESASARFPVNRGMFQAGRETRARNRQPFGFDPHAIDFVLLTHAYIDHRARPSACTGSNQRRSPWRNGGEPTVAGR